MIFILDLNSSTAIASGTIYCIAILYSWLFKWNLAPVSAGIFCTGLIILAFILKDIPETTDHLQGVNPAISIISIWICVSLVALAKKGFASLQEYQDSLEIQIEKKTAEAKSSAKRFRDFLESAPDAFIVINEEGRIELVNQETELLFDYNRADLLGEKMDLIVKSSEEAATTIEFIDKYKDHRFESGLELTGIKSNGSEVPIEMNLSPFESSDGLYVSVAIRDISERKEAQRKLKSFNKQLQFKNKELEQFVYISSHDLQEPLRTVTSFVTLLKEQYSDVLDENASLYIKFINQSVVRMQQFIKGLLEYGRIGREKNVEDVDSRQVLQEIQEDLFAVINETKAEIELKNMPQIRAYKHDFRQLMLNLLSNAIKFRKAGEPPKIEINGQKIENGWKFSVKDNGIGIDPKFEDKVFTIFQRLHTRKEYQGTGIGLAHCKKIIEMHQGEIWMDSTVGKGTTFYFTIMEILQ